MAKSKYQFSDGKKSRYGVSAQTLGEHLEQLRVARGGDISPHDLVQEARDNDSVLHPFFTWDERKAAHEHRLWQARQLLGSIEVAYRVTDDAPTQAVRAFVNVNSDEGRSYTSMVEAMSDTQRRAIILTAALDELEAFQRKYQHLQEFASLFAAARTIKRPALPKGVSKQQAKDLAAELR
jgi:hypothetical protein